MVDFGINKTQESIPNLPQALSNPDVQGRVVEDTSSQTDSKAVVDSGKVETSSPKGMKDVLDQLMAELGHGTKQAAKPEVTEDSFKDSREELNKVISDMNTMAKGMRNDVRFQISEESGELIVQVIDRETNEVLRTIPPEYLVDLRMKIRKQVGMVLDREL